MGKKTLGWRVKFDVYYTKESGKLPEYRWYTSKLSDPRVAKVDAVNQAMSEEDVKKVSFIKSEKVKNYA